MKTINDVLNYEFETGDVVVWNECGLVAICESEEEAKELGITKDDAESYFIYDIDEDVTENFNKERFGRILSAQQASIMLGLSRPSISYHIKKGNLEIKNGGITLESVELLKRKPRNKGGRPLGSFRQN